MELSSRSSNSLRYRILTIVRNRPDIEDVMQGVLVKASTRLIDFWGSCSFSTWLTRIAIDSALMLLRKKKSCSGVSHDQQGNEDRKREVWDFPDPSPNPEQAYRKQHLANQIIARSQYEEPARGPEEWHDQLKSLQQWVCELLITNQQLRMALESTMAQEKKEVQDGYSN